MRKIIIASLMLLPTYVMATPPDLSALEAATFSIQAKKEADDRAETSRRLDEQRRLSAAAESERNRQRNATDAANKRKAEELAKKEALAKRDRDFEDELRDIEIQMRRQQLEQYKTRVARENDVIDAELNTQKVAVDALAEAAKMEAEAMKIKAANPDTINSTIINK